MIAGGTGQLTINDSLESVDLIRNLSTTLQPISYPRYEHRSVAIDDYRILVLDGPDRSGEHAFSSTELYDSRLNQ